MTSTPGELPFSIERAHHHQYSVLRLTGEFDLRAAPDLREAFVEVFGEDASGEAVLVDMSGLGFLDSTIISVLLIANQRASAAGKSLRLVGVSPYVARVFDVTGIDGVLSSYASLEEAVAV